MWPILHRQSDISELLQSYVAKNSLHLLLRHVEENHYRNSAHSIYKECLFLVRDKLRMEKEQIAELFSRFESACYDYKGIECWSARELQKEFNYTDWRNFIKVIDKAKDACKNAGGAVSDHFVELNKMVDLGSGSQREVEEILL